jgi:acetoin utilization protein AcuB
MLVGRWMTAAVVTVRPNDSVVLARQRLRDHRIRHLPVTDGPRLLGIATEQDLRLAEAAGERANQSLVADVMTTSVITVGPETTVEQAALLMVENKIGGLPVVDGDDQVVGIITESDILNVFLGALGVGSEAARLEVLLPDQPGALARMATILADLGANIISILSIDEEGGSKVLILRVAALDLEAVLSALAAAGVDVQSAEAAV